MDKQKKVLLVSHDLLLTGAPVALHYAAKSLKELGYYVVVLSPRDGLMRSEIVADQIPVIIDSSIYNDAFWIKYASNFDVILVNTLVQFKLIEQLQKTQIPVLWWLHEASDYYEKIKKTTTLPSELSSNIQIACVGTHAKKILERNTQWKDVKNLIYCVPDFAEQVTEKMNCPIDLPKGRKIFLSVGTLEARKGQDILAMAIRHLDSEELKNAYFIFVGMPTDEKIYNQLKALYSDYPESIRLIERLSRKDMQLLYCYCNCVICSSRDDPMPVIMTEAMMMSCPVICSENTGTAGLICDGENGYIYRNNQWEQLLEKIRLFITGKIQTASMGEKARKTYEENFTENVFKKRIHLLVSEMMEKTIS